MKSMMNKLNKIGVVLLCFTALMSGVARAELLDKSAEIMEHLKLLGYSVKLGKDDSIVAYNRPLYPKLYVDRSDLGLLVSSVFSVPNSLKNQSELYKKINECNELDLVKLAYSEKGDFLFATAVYTGSYQKELFGQFINMFTLIVNLHSNIMTKK